MSLSSLRVRLLIAWAVFIFVTLQIAGAGLIVLFERSITARTLSELKADLRQLQRGMEVAPDGSIVIVREPTDPQFDIGFGGRYWEVLEGNEILLRSRSLREAKLELPHGAIIPSDGARLSLLGPKEQGLFAFGRPHEIVTSGHSKILTIITAVDEVEIREETSKFSSDLYRGLAALAALLFIGALVHVSVGLRPLENLRSKVAAVREGSSLAIDGRYPEEVMPLVNETNALLAAQQIQLKTARQRAADLAHGLNTPLAVMSVKSRSLRREGAVDLADDIDRQIATMRRHVERELALAGAGGGSRIGVPLVDITLLTRNLVSAIQSLPRDRPLAWSIDLPAKRRWAVDADDFNNMLGNLLENAHKWASSRAHVSMHVDRSTACVISVEDDGPGIAESDMARVVLRGERADTSTAGTGLGLAIVTDIVELYRGTLMLAKSPLGGIKATMTLPRSLKESSLRS